MVLRGGWEGRLVDRNLKIDRPLTSQPGTYVLIGLFGEVDRLMEQEGVSLDAFLIEPDGEFALGPVKVKVFIQEEMKEDFCLVFTDLPLKLLIDFLFRIGKGRKVQLLREVESNHGDTHIEGLPDLIEGLQVVSVCAVAPVVVLLENGPGGIPDDPGKGPAGLFVLPDRLLGQDRPNREFPDGPEVAGCCTAQTIPGPNRDRILPERDRLRIRKEFHQAGRILGREITDLERRPIVVMVFPLERVFPNHFLLSKDDQSFFPWGVRTRP